MEKLDLLYQAMVLIVTHVMLKMKIDAVRWIRLAIRGGAIFMIIMALVSILDILTAWGIIKFSISASLESN